MSRGKSDRGWRWVGLAVLAMCVSCSSSDTAPAPKRCPKGLFPCGKGCIPTSAVCCDDGSGKTSSYCANAAGGGCRPGPCPSPSTESGGGFCCDATDTVGSFDCPDGRVHCGTACQPAADTCCFGGKCCPEGASVEDCPLAISDDECGTGSSERVTPCGYCRHVPFCRICPAGTCCQGNPDFTGDVCDSVFKCVSGAEVCPGIRGGGSAGADAGTDT